MSVKLDPHGDHVAVLTVDNPPANTLSFASRADLLSKFQEIDRDHQVRAVVLRGAGRHFTGGGDLREDQQMSDEGLMSLLEDIERLLGAVEGLRVPVVAAINGAVAGGGLDLALACDIRIASEDAQFIAAGVNVGLIANFWRLPRTIGLGPAKDLLLTGAAWDASRALQHGLVTKVVAPDQLLATALEVASRIASRAPLSVERTKAYANQAFDLGPDEALRAQIEQFAAMFRTRDHQEAMEAFFGCRTPQFLRQ